RRLRAVGRRHRFAGAAHRDNAILVRTRPASRAPALPSLLQAAPREPVRGARRLDRLHPIPTKLPRELLEGRNAARFRIRAPRLEASEQFLLPLRLLGPKRLEA